MTQTNETVRRPLLGSRLLRAPRIVRILVAALSAFAFGLLVDRLFEASFFDEQTAGTTLIISTIVGLIAYAIGWWLMLGFSDDNQGVPPARRALPIYLALSLAVLLVGISLAVIALATTYGGG